MKNVKDAPIIEVMSPPGIVMYPWAFEKNPEPDESGQTWFGVMLKFPKNWDFSDISPGFRYEGDPAAEFLSMRRQFTAAARQGWPNGNDLNGMKFTPDFGSPVRDGDIINKANNKKNNEELNGHFYVNFKSKSKPGLVRATNGGLVDIIDKEAFYPGCIAVVSGVAFPYENKGNEGVGTRLTNICMLADGERIGGKPAAKSQFEKFGKGAPTHNESDDDLI